MAERALTTRAARRRLIGPAIFGAIDGMTVVLGVLLPLHDKARLVVLSAASGVAAAELVGMAVGEWLADEACNWPAAALIGLTSALGAILPAVAFAAAPHRIRLWAACAVIAAIGAGIAYTRHRMGRGSRAWAETFGLLAAAGAVCTLVAVLAPS